MTYDILFYLLGLGFALIGMPLFLVLGYFALVAFTLNGIDASAVMVEIYRIASAPTLSTIPMFTIAGFFLAESKAPKRLLLFTQAIFGWLPGGSAVVGLLLCAFFTAFTGASGVTIIALGGLIFPILIAEGFSERFALGLITSSGSLGLLLPPSLPLILYGIVAKVDIDTLFRAGILPAAFLITILAIYSYFQVNKSATKKNFSTPDVVAAIKAARYELPLPIVILGSIYGGMITITEAATLTLVYTFIVEFWLYKDLSIGKDLVRIIKESMLLVGAILLILCCAMGFTNFLVDEEIPMKILASMENLITNKYIFLFVLNIFLLIVGCMMDIFSAIIVVVPLILPIANKFGVDPIHLAMIFLTNLEIGYITPPVGLNLFISSYRFNKPMMEIYRASVGFLVVLLIGLLIITYIPWLSVAFTH
ncbi:MAG: TRAP transporter large permease subunit [Bacteriovoracaceae bacterium]|nr:TRAP transporter large permease subunit [Bacteriovoracaceae bacterium]